jgi:hypothetical protein
MAGVWRNSRNGASVKPELYEPLSGDFRPLQRVASSLETGSKNKTDMKKNRR